MAIRDRVLLALLLVQLTSEILFAGGSTLKPGPIQAELVGKLDAAHLKTGDAVYAKVISKWQDENVTLREGSILKGRVVAQSEHSKTSKSSQLALFFDSVEYTRNDSRPLHLTLAAVMAPDDSDREPTNYQPLTEAVGVVLQGNFGGVSPTRSVEAAADTSYYMPRRDKRPKSITVGQVVGVPGLKLSVGGGPEGSSVLYTSGHNVHLQSGSLLAFLPPGSEAPRAPSIAAPNGTAAAASPAPVAAPLENDLVGVETDACAPPECSIVPPADLGQPNATAASALPVGELGYTQPVVHELSGFNYDSAVAYLGPNKLLFTFNPHLLVKRSNLDADAAKLHLVRAVVVNLTTMKVEQSADWRVHDANQYLWPLRPGNVLVHAGRELRLYGPDLKQKQSLALDGPLAFVAMSPSKTYFAVGVVQERHSAEVHRALAAAGGREPEEDIEVRIFDDQFHLLGTVLRSSRSSPPVLSDKGEVGAISLGHARWRIEEQSWDRHTRVIAHIASACRPQLMSLPQNLLFAVGCDRQSEGRWYRVLRANGKPLLKGWSPSAELEHSVISSAAGDVFAISVVKATRSIARGSLFQTADLESQQINVYRLENGKRVFAYRFPAPVPTKQTVGLSPMGDQLAVLTGDRISFSPIPSANGGP